MQALREWTDEELRIRTLGHSGKLHPGDVSSVTLLGSKVPVAWEQTADALAVRMPNQRPCDFAYALRIDRK